MNVHLLYLNAQILANKSAGSKLEAPQNKILYSVPLLFRVQAVSQQSTSNNQTHRDVNLEG